ncbi:MAG: tyrosine-type recombinase/integrase [Vicinamibacterales bacterium]
MTLGKTLDGPEAPNAARTCPKLPVPRPEPRGLPWPLIQRILAAMRPSATRTRLEVMATTGLAHAMLMRLRPEDLHLTGPRPYLVVRPRRKGAGVQARAIPITPDAVRALRGFVKAQLFGPFSRHSMHKSFVRAATKAQAPAGVRPYDLRHSHAVRLYAATHDLRAVAELLMHSHLATTSRYAAQAVTGTAQAAVDALAGGTTGGTARRRSRKPLSRP